MLRHMLAGFEPIKMFPTPGWEAHRRPNRRTVALAAAPTGTKGFKDRDAIRKGTAAAARQWVVEHMPSGPLARVLDIARAMPLDLQKGGTNAAAATLHQASRTRFHDGFWVHPASLEDMKRLMVAGRLVRLSERGTHFTPATNSRYPSKDAQGK